MDTDSGKERAIATLARVWVIFSTITSVIGLISIVDDLKSWGLLARHVMDWLFASMPPLHELLRLLGVAIHQVLEFYRGIVHPVFRWLFGWLPFQIPGALIDLVTVVALSVAGFYRERLSASGVFERAYDKFVRDLRKQLAADHINVSEEDVLAVFNALIRDPSGWHYTEGEPPWHRNDLLSRVLGPRVDHYAREPVRIALDSYLRVVDFSHILGLGVLRRLACGRLVGAGRARDSLPPPQRSCEGANRRA